MSVQRGCEFFEPEPGKWFYLLDDSNIRHAWDWRENADCYGPFPSENAAHKHLHDNHANPGGCEVTCNAEFTMQPVYKAAIKAARLRLW